MTLKEKQFRFANLVALLIVEANARGYTISLGEVWRSPEEAQRQGQPKSLHTMRLAIDINLFKDGVWLKKTEDHRPLGEWWETLHPLCAWGGRWGDGNHYSMEHGGMK